MLIVFYRSEERGASERVHVHPFFLHLVNDWEHRAEIWYATRDLLANLRFTQIMGRVDVIDYAKYIV